MAGRRVGFIATNKAVNASAGVTIMQVVGASGGDVAITEIEVYGTDTSSTNPQATVKVVRQTTAGTAGGTVTGQKLDSGTGTITTVVNNDYNGDGSTGAPTSASSAPLGTMLPTNGKWAWRGYIPVRSTERWGIVVTNNHSGALTFGARCIVEE